MIPPQLRAHLKLFDINVFRGNLEEGSFPDDEFDAITISHVIEHVLDPIRFLQECKRILKPNGTVVIITPDSQNLGRRIFGKYWRGWEVPRHIFVFSPLSLRMIVQRVEFKVLKIWTISGSARWMWVAGHLLKRRGTLPGGIAEKIELWIKIESIFFWILEYILSKVKDVGEELVLIATK